MGNHTRRIKLYVVPFGPSRVTPNKGSRSPIWDVVYISEVNRAGRSNLRAVSYEQELRPRAEIFPWGY